MAALCPTPRTLLLIGTVLSLYGSNLAASTGSESGEEHFELSESCKTVENFRKCWNNHYDLPSCGNEKSLTLTCAERVGTSLTKCNQDKVLKYAGVLIKTIRASDKALCDNRDLKEFFKNDGYCWHAARNCAKYMIISKTYTYNCSIVTEERKECIEDTIQKCINNLQQYTKAIWNAHPCSIATVTTIAPSTSAIAAIDSPLTLLLFALQVALVLRRKP